MTSSKPSEEQDAEPRLRLRLYVAGESPNSVAAIANLRAALAQLPDRPADLEIIDILRDPQQGLRDGITMTPMLVKIEPPPERRVLGNLRDRVVLLGALDINEAARE